MPASRQRANIRWLVASSASPPKDIVPKHSDETFTPVEPRLTYSIARPSLSMNLGDQGERRDWISDTWYLERPARRELLSFPIADIQYPVPPLLRDLRGK